jgi:hypothetical protein
MVERRDWIREGKAFKSPWSSLSEPGEVAVFYLVCIFPSVK